jgi:hypothetical protein
MLPCSLKIFLTSWAAINFTIQNLLHIVRDTYYFYMSVFVPVCTMSVPINNLWISLNRI